MDHCHILHSPRIWDVLASRLLFESLGCILELTAWAGNVDDGLDVVESVRFYCSAWCTKLEFLIEQRLNLKLFTLFVSELTVYSVSVSGKEGSGFYFKTSQDHSSFFINIITVIGVKTSNNWLIFIQNLWYGSLSSTKFVFWNKPSCSAQQRPKEKTALAP